MVKYSLKMLTDKISHIVKFCGFANPNQNQQGVYFAN